MGRRFLSLFAAALAAASLAAGCSSMRAPEPEGLDPDDATPKVYDLSGPSPFATVGNALVSVPETAIWWPYKIATSAVRGGYDAVAGGVEKAPLPIVGIVASPLTAAAGIVHGAVKGVVRGPAYVGSTAQFGQVLGQPWVEPIPIW